ncbi:PH domain-containing protein [Falsigemmobacter faecalis]|nr:PH domain-containing protein [Falsigemmobacter faecalis]
MSSPTEIFERMTVDVRRSARGTLSSLVSLGLFLGAGCLLLSREYMALRPSTAMIIVGVLLLLWAGVISNGLRRPVLMSADGTGVRVRRLIGHHSFAWKDLTFANFDGSDRAVILGGYINGNMRYAAVPKRIASVADLEEAAALFAQHRPDLPQTMGQPGIPLAQTKESAE